MHFVILTQLLILLPSTILANPIAGPATGCSAVTIITARGSTEAAGEGSIGSLASLIQSKSTQTTSRKAVTYSASLANYAASVAGGVSAMTSDLKSLVSSCPNTKIVLIGYSQGAECVGDTLGGGGGGFLGAATAAVDYATIGSHVKAAIMYGDPRFTTSQSAFSVGTCRQNGIYPRAANQALTQYNNIFKSYCDTGDPFCCSGFDTMAHLGYTSKYNSEALTFVLKQIGG